MTRQYLGMDSYRLDPPELHETDECLECHNEGDHNPLDYYEVCDSCAKELTDRTKHLAIEFTFSMADVEKAREWARANRYHYESVDHLMLDAIRSNVIMSDHWQSID